MNDFLRFIGALKILGEYSGSGAITAEHDQVWAGHDYKRLLTEDDHRKMEQLGWFWDSDVGAYRISV